MFRTSRQKAPWRYSLIFPLIRSYQQGLCIRLEYTRRRRQKGTDSLYLPRCLSKKTVVVRRCWDISRDSLVTAVQYCRSTRVAIPRGIVCEVLSSKLRKPFSNCGCTVFPALRRSLGRSVDMTLGGAPLAASAVNEKRYNVSRSDGGPPLHRSSCMARS